LIGYYFHKQKAGHPVPLLQTLDLYLVSTYSKYSDPEKKNKIEFEVLNVCVFIWIYKEQLFY
jgi:hypothetical protein